MQARNSNPSEQDLLKYKKQGYEYVQEEKMVLDAIIMLYRKRLKFTQKHLEALKELQSTAKANFDPESTLYGNLVFPILDCLEKDIAGYMHNVRCMEEDLGMFMFPTGSDFVVQEIKRDLEAVKPLHVEYEHSRASVMGPTPLPNIAMWPSSAKWPYVKDIKHRQITARLHSKQKVAQMHFERTYPKLLDDHMEYMEQVKKLMRRNSAHQSELATTIACNASAERDCIERFSTADAIAMPYAKMGLERDRREYQRAPVLNLFTRELEEGPTVILGRDIDLGSDDDFALEVLMACLDRYVKVTHTEWSDLNWRNYWGIIHAMESNPNRELIRELVNNFQHGYEIEYLIRILMENPWTPGQLLNIVDWQSLTKLAGNHWNRFALNNAMKDVDPRVRGILKACAIVSHLSPTSTVRIIHLVIPVGHTGSSTTTSSVRTSVEIALRMWDCDSWCALPDNTQWRGRWTNEGKPSLYRLKRFRAKPGYASGVVDLEVDSDGNIRDTDENQVLKQWLEEEQVQVEPKSKMVKVLQKLKI